MTWDKGVELPVKQTSRERRGCQKCWKESRGEHGKQGRHFTGESREETLQGDGFPPCLVLLGDHDAKTDAGTREGTLINCWHKCKKCSLYGDQNGIPQKE